MSIDPSLRKKQEEWVDAISKASLDDYEDRGESSVANVTDRYKLGSMWLMDAIVARGVDFPQNNYEFMLYQISRSAWLRFVYNLACIAQIVVPFFAAPGCEFAVGKTQDKFIVVDVICLVVYLFDLGLVFSVNPANKKLSKKPWSAFRLFCCFLLFLECIAFASADFAGVRIVRCVFPLILISRRSNLQKILQGTLTAGIRSAMVLIALFSVILLWSFVGFLVFRDINPEDGGVQRYDTFSYALFTTLHCFTSRPYCLMAMKPYFELNEFAAVFFVTLTLSADLICISLIIAIASSEYKLFVAQYLQRRMHSRAFTTRLVFDSFCNKEKRLERSAWCKLCDSMSDKYHRSHGEAGIMFALEDEQNTGSIDYLSFVRLCALIAQRVVIMVPEDMKNVSYDAKVPVRPLLSAAFGDNDTSSHQELRDSLVIMPAVNDVSVIGAQADDIPRLNRTNTATTASYGRILSQSSKQNMAHKKYRRYHLASILGTSHSAGVTRCIDNVSNNCFVVLSASISVKLWAGKVWTMTLRDLIVFVLYILLIVYLVNISAFNCAQGWFSFGFVLESLFWFDMLVHMCAFGWSEYSQRLLNRLTVLVNISSLIAMIVLSSHRGNYNKSGPILAVILIQAMRMLSPFFMINEVAIFERIFPILIRTGFIYFSFLYFYAIWAHQFFCGDLDTTLAADSDDDSTLWVSYASMLNFHTYLQSLFTMFEMTVLGNWSIVMDAAAKKSATGSYVFFYSFRLLATLNVLPVLLGFIMQAFITARKDLLNSQKEQSAAARPSTASAQSPNGMGNGERQDSLGSAGPSSISSPYASTDGSIAGLNLVTFNTTTATTASTDANRDRTGSDQSPPAESMDSAARPSYAPPSVGDVTPSKDLERKRQSVLPEISLSTQKRVDTTPQYAISGNKAASSSRLSLWNDGAGPVPPSATTASNNSRASQIRSSSVVSPSAAQATTMKESDKDAVIKFLQEQLNAAQEELRQAKAEQAMDE
jgi:hypothetical protein